MASSAVLTTAPALEGQRRWWSDAIWVAIANLSQAAGPFLGLVLLTRWHGLHAAGEFALAQAITAPLAQLGGFQLKALILTHSEDELSTGEAAGFRMWTSLPVTLGCLLLGWWGGAAVGVWMLGRLTDSWGETMQAIDQRQNRMPRAAISVVARTVLMVACLGLAPDLLAAGLSYVVGSFVLFGLLDWRQELLGMPLATIGWRVWVKRGTALGLMLFLQSTAASLPRILLETKWDKATLGLFASLFVLVQAGNLLCSSLGQALLPTFRTAGVGRVAAWTLATVGFATGAMILELPLAPWIFELLRVPPSDAAHALLRSFGYAQLVIWPAGIVGYALSARRLYGQLLAMGIALVAVSGLVSLWLIPRWGAQGAVCAIAASCTVTLLMSFVYLHAAEARQ